MKGYFYECDDCSDREELTEQETSYPDEIMEDDGWLKLGYKWYCPSCRVKFYLP